MRSLQWRMLAALCLVIALAWSISIAMFVSYLNTGPSSAWNSHLHALGQKLVRVLPDEWIKRHAPWVSTSAASLQAFYGTENLPESMLVAAFLNTLELLLVGVMMWGAVVISLHPLRAMSTDIGKRKPLDSEPLSIDKIPGELRPLMRAFNALLSRVDAAMRSERQFIADAAHELRTPLAALHVQGDVALRANTLERKDEALRKLLDISRRTYRLAEQLLDLARLDAGLHADDLHDTDLLELSRHVIDEFEIQASGRGTRLFFFGKSCVVKCDIDAIGILIRNLVDNAIRHGRESGTVEIRCGYLDRDDGRHPMLEVRDDGPGVAKQDREAIFTRFYRVTGTTVQGSGIGLSLVAGIAALHSAVIETGPDENLPGFLVRIVFPVDPFGAKQGAGRG
jgi:signal transduction histidine kinase